MHQEQYCTYIMSNQKNTVLYIGVTNNLHKRTLEHKEKRGSIFTKKYNIDKLVYFEEYGHPQDAIAREKQLKNYSRQKKNQLVQFKNPQWKDLFNEISLW